MSQICLISVTIIGGMEIKTPAAAGVRDDYLTTRNPGRLGTEPDGEIGLGLGDGGGFVGAGSGGCGFCSGSNIMPWPFSRA